MPSLQPAEDVSLAGRRIFVTGGTGFVGRSWLDRVVGDARSAGEAPAEVCVLSRNPEAFLGEWSGYGKLPWLRWRRGDLSTLRAEPSDRFDGVMHAAADTHLDSGRADWLEQLAIGTRRALDFSLACGATRFLLLSSGAVYGPSTGAPIPESDSSAPSTLDPRSTYGQGKRLAEQLVTAYRHEHGLETVVARCFALVGEHLPLDGRYALGDFIGDALAGRPIRVRGDGETVRSYLDGDDLGRWLTTLLVRGRGGSAYNVGSDEPVRMVDAARDIRDILLPGGEVLVEGLPDGGARPRYVPSIDLAATLGLRVWTPWRLAVERAAVALASRSRARH
jgi:dTDP-glucose 4,6-dehydratase